MKYEVCPICGSPCFMEIKTDPFFNQISCYRCGKFTLNESGMNYLNTINNSGLFKVNVKVNISGWIREHQGEDVILNKEKLNSLSQLRDLSVFEKADKVMIFLSYVYPFGGIKLDFEYGDINNLLININQGKYKEIINLKEEDFIKNIGKRCLPIVAISRSIDYHEFSYI